MPFGVTPRTIPSSVPSISQDWLATMAKLPCGELGRSVVRSEDGKAKVWGGVGVGVGVDNDPTCLFLFSFAKRCVWFAIGEDIEESTWITKKKMKSLESVPLGFLLWWILSGRRPRNHHRRWRGRPRRLSSLGTPSAPTVARYRSSGQACRDLPVGAVENRDSGALQVHKCILKLSDTRAFNHRCPAAGTFMAGMAGVKHRAQRSNTQHRQTQPARPHGCFAQREASRKRD